MPKFLTCIVLFLIVAACPAQQPYSYTLNDDNGLPSNEVFDLHQDAFGFMWIGTNAGLFRYDGTDFVAVKNPQVTGKAISHLTVDDNNKLWCQNFSGQIFSVRGDSLVLEYNWSKRRRNFPAFTVSSSKAIWITADSGLYSFDLQSGKALSFFNMETLSGHSSVYELVEVASIGNRIYYCEKNAIGYIEQGKVTRLAKTNETARFKELLYGSSFHNAGTHTYVLSRTPAVNSVWEIRNDSIVWLRNLPAALGRVFTAYNDNKGGIWIGGSNGACCFSYELKEQYAGKLFFQGKSVSGILLDKEGSYWFSTLQDGVFVVPGTEVWLHTEANSSLADSRVRQLETDGGESLFIGYQNGKLSRYSTTNGTIGTIGFPNSLTDVQALYFDPFSESLIVSQGKTWLVKPGSMQATFVSGLSNVKAFCHINTDTFVAGAVAGALLFKPGATAKYLQALRPKRVRSVFYEKPDARLWVAYTDGLYIYESGRQSESLINGKPVFGVDVVQTANGIVWVGTLTKGIIGFEDGQPTQPVNCNILNGFVRKLAANGNTLWIATEDRLIRYDVVTKETKSYNRFDGLPSYEIADIAFAAGKIWLATPKGLVEIPENFNAVNRVPPSVFVSGFAVHERDTILTASYKLRFADNNIRISFKGIAFRSQGAFTYKYRLLGLDTTWITTNSRSNFARYPSLPAGNYTFQVIALNEDGIPSTNPATLYIEVLKPFWQTWWFYVMCGLVLVALVSVAFMLRIRYIRRKGELEKRVVNSQLAAIKSQMNPHFMFNALNSIQDLVLQHDTGNAQLYLGKFSELTRRVLEASGKEFISLQQETDMLSLYLDLEKLRFGNDFTYSLSVDGQIDMQETFVPSMIIQPFVENALKHGLLHKDGRKELKLDFLVQRSVLICVIDDNGIGRNASAEINARRKRHTSFAGEATAERLRLLSELHNIEIDLSIADKEQGTCVTIKIPLLHEGHYS